MVYAARAPDGTPAAVKVMRVGEEEQEAYLGRFEREAQMRVDHPNVVRLLGAGLHDDGSPWSRQHRPRLARSRMQPC